MLKLWILIILEIAFAGPSSRPPPTGRSSYPPSSEVCAVGSLWDRVLDSITRLSRVEHQLATMSEPTRSQLGVQVSGEIQAVGAITRSIPPEAERALPRRRARALSDDIDSLDRRITTIETQAAAHAQGPAGSSRNISDFTDFVELDAGVVYEAPGFMGSTLRFDLDPDLLNDLTDPRQMNDETRDRFLAAMRRGVSRGQGEGGFKRLNDISGSGVDVWEVKIMGRGGDWRIFGCLENGILHLLLMGRHEAGGRAYGPIMNLCRSRAR